MAIDISEKGNGYKELRRHIGHEIVCVDYAGENVAIECETCGEVLVSFDKPERKTKKEKGCNCTSCGAKFKKKDIDGGRCTNCGTMIC